MWKNQYEKLLNSSSQKGNTEYLNLLCAESNLSPHKINTSDISIAIDNMKNGKSCGSNGLYAEHFKHAHPSIHRILSVLFTCMISHCYLPDEFMKTVIIPLVKNKKGDLTSQDNYRPVATTSVMSKIMEIVLLQQLKHLLTSSSNQFGFKERHSTDQCVFTLKYIIDFYCTNSTPVYVCFIDASKAFDRVNHDILFSKLIEREFPTIIVRFLRNWYSKQLFCVQWGSIRSTSFNVTNGVRQGGVLSPFLFNVCMDSLSDQLNAVNVGCEYNGILYNHLMYADDTVLIAPSPRALQTLINTSVSFAQENDLVYNKTKTKVMTITPRCMKNLHIPKFILGDKEIDVCKEEKYLGCILLNNLCDDVDIQKEIRNIYIRGNMLINNFRHCCNHVKNVLFKTFCSNFYCNQLWCNYNASSLKAAHIAFNNVYRRLMNADCYASMSTLFVYNRLDNFYVLRRKSIYNFLSRLKCSENELLKNITESQYFSVSSFMREYVKILYI